MKSVPLSLFWYRIRLAWFWTRRVLGILFLTILGWDFVELLGMPIVPILKQAVYEEFTQTFPMNLFIKENPAKIQAKIEEEERIKVLEWAQAHCRHIHKRNGLWDYFCPLCGKKLIPDVDPPMWQI